MRQPQAANSSLRHRALDEQDDDQRQEQAERRGRLDPGGVVAAAVVGRMLRHIGRRAAIFAAQRQALQHAQRDQDHRRGDAPARRPRQQADQEGRQAHDHDGDEEGVFASDEVADPPEHQRAERPHQEAGRKRQQREDVAGGFRILCEERRADERGQRAVKIEVVPLEDGAERGGEDDLPFLARHAAPAGVGTARNCHGCSSLDRVVQRVPRALPETANTLPPFEKMAESPAKRQRGFGSMTFV